jgi:SAM-dependent methyltransferase
MFRVAHNTDPGDYIALGAKAAAYLISLLSQRPQSVRDVLDWGCGPGRVAAHILDTHPELALRGCDIDAEAVAWANKHLDGRFDTCDIEPPLPYAGESFDAVLALSVMTHLDRGRQLAWCAEIARVLRPGGMFVASVHGYAAAESAGVSLRRLQIADHYLSEELQGIAPFGYYRDVFQDPLYTRVHWAKYFEVTAYHEQAVDLHDVVVCVKP